MHSNSHHLHLHDDERWWYRSDRAPPVCPICPAPIPPPKAWDAYLDGVEPTVLAAGELYTPSADVVYQITLENPLVLVPIDIVSAGSFAFFFEHGSDEVGTALVSPSDEVLAATFEESAEEEQEEEEETGSATASKWANAVVASLIVSACRLANFGCRTYGDEKFFLIQ